jgi:hemerythrin-like domain-containing protein
MDAIALLKADHKTVKGLFRDFEQTGERAHKQKHAIAVTILRELDLHAAIEEEIFYPAVMAKAPKELKETLLEGIQEHHVVHVLVDELRAMDGTEEEYAPKVTVLIENVEHHIEEEESELLPQAKEILGDDLKLLGEQMAAHKQQLQTKSEVTPSA